MMSEISFYIDGVPVAKGRPKVFRTRSGIGARTPKKTSDYEERIADAAKRVWSFEPLLCPIKLSIIAVFPIAVSQPKWKQTLAAIGLWHVAKPDLDNVIKIVGDGLNEVIWRDDGQVCWIDARKQIGPVPGLWATITPLEDIGMGHNNGPELDDG